jgi:hypothetical protein
MTEGVPALKLGEFEHDSKGKPILLIFPSGDSIGFSTIENASAYLSSAHRAGLTNPEEVRLFQWRDGDWVEIT